MGMHGWLRRPRRASPVFRLIRQRRPMPVYNRMEAVILPGTGFTQEPDLTGHLMTRTIFQGASAITILGTIQTDLSTSQNNCKPLREERIQIQTQLTAQQV